MTNRSLALAALCLGCTGVISGIDGESTNSPETATPSTSSAPVDCTNPDQPGPRILRLLTREEYAATVADLLKIEKPAVDDLPVEPRVAGFDNNAAASVVTSRHLDGYLAVAERVLKGAKLVTCDASQVTCRNAFVDSFGRRAFRRPLTADEKKRFDAMFATDVSPTASDGVMLVAQAMLVSPSFLYRSELGVPNGDGTFALTPFELATALSYTFLGVGPDDRLLDLAASGSLDVELEARALLNDPKSRPGVARFFNAWLDTSALLSANKDKAIYPAFTDPVREGLAAEQAAFVNNVVFDSSHAFTELFTADYIFANDAVASFYGLPAPGGLKKIAAGDQRGGILTLGSVLAAQAHANGSSPIRRGRWVRDRLLCQELTPPPPSADTTPPGLDASLTTRERFAKHTSSAACKSCHQFIDGVGFAFERYDGVGAYRATENGKPIDDSGDIKGREGLDTGTSDKFTGPKGLAALLAKSESAPRCFATQWFRFARGLREEGQEICTARALGSKFLEKGQDIRELMIAAMTQRSFLVRREK